MSSHFFQCQTANRTIGKSLFFGLITSLFAAALMATAADARAFSCSDSNVRCVDSGGSQKYSGIQAAVDAAVPGDTVLVFDGNYAGFIVSHSGTTSAPIVIRANGSQANITSASSTGSGVSLKGQLRHYPRFQYPKHAEYVHFRARRASHCTDGRCRDPEQYLRQIGSGWNLSF